MVHVKLLENEKGFILKEITYNSRHILKRYRSKKTILAYFKNDGENYREPDLEKNLINTKIKI